MRLGILGGSFDPVHYGHLLMAECCLEQCRLDEVLFVPAAVPPHKQSHPLTPASERIDMLELAISGREAFRVSRIEIERGGISYTADTLDELKRQQPAAELFLLLGADSLDDLPRWHDPRRICAQSTPVAVSRPGAPALDYQVLAPLVSAERLVEIQRYRVEMPQIGLSSSDIRHRVAQGLSIRYRTPRAVEKYIETHGLYRASNASAEAH